MKTAPEQLAQVYKTLGEKNRLKTIKILSSQMEDAICVNDVSRMLGISQPSASQHLKILKIMDLIKESKEGSHVYYTLNLSKMYEYKKLIDDTFIKAFNKCLYDFKCSECPVGATCL